MRAYIALAALLSFSAVASAPRLTAYRSHFSIVSGDGLPLADCGASTMCWIYDEEISNHRIGLAYDAACGRLLIDVDDHAYDTGCIATRLSRFTAYDRFGDVLSGSLIVSRHGPILSVRSGTVWTASKFRIEAK